MSIQQKGYRYGYTLCLMEPEKSLVHSLIYGLLLLKLYPVVFYQIICLFVFTCLCGVHSHNSSVFFVLFTGSPREYLQHYVFPVLVPAMEEMLRQAKKEKCFEV